MEALMEAALVPTLVQALIEVIGSGNFSGGLICTFANISWHRLNELHAVTEAMETATAAMNTAATTPVLLNGQPGNLQLMRLVITPMH